MTSIVCLVTGALALLGYLATLAPSITWRNDGADSGDLVAAAYTLGIPHPPGYPLYTLLASVFAHLPLAEPARGANLFSALAAAGAVALTTVAVLQMAAARLDRRPALLVAGAVALCGGFAPLFWSQAVIAEVYALNALLVAALVVVSLSALSHRLQLAALITGLGLAHDPAIAALAPSALILLTDSVWSRRQVGCALVLLFAPLFLYLYLPIRASAAPPINWGNPVTLESFWWMVSAAPYRPYLTSLSPGDLVARVAATARLLFQQYQVWGVALGLWGIAVLWSGRGDAFRRKLAATALGFLLVAAYAVLLGSRDSYVHLLPAFLVFVLWMAIGLGDVVSRLPQRWAGMAIAGALVLMPGYNLAANFQPVDVSKDREAFDYARSVFASVPTDAVILTQGDAHLFALLYYRHAMLGNASSVAVISGELLQYDWYYRQARSLTSSTAPENSDYQLRVHEMIDQGLKAGRQVYVSSSPGLISNHALQPEGLVYRLREEGK